MSRYEIGKGAQVVHMGKNLEILGLEKSVDVSGKGLFTENKQKVQFSRVDSHFWRIAPYWHFWRNVLVRRQKHSNPGEFRNFLEGARKFVYDPRKGWGRI